MRVAILFLALALVASATQEEDIPYRQYADALDDLESAIGSGTHGTEEDTVERRHHSNTANKEELSGYKKKIDIRKAERERRALDDINKINEELQQQLGTDGEDDIPHTTNDRTKYHKRQIQKQKQINDMHKSTLEILDDHHEGRKLLKDVDLEHHTRRLSVLSKKKRSLETESPERVSLYIFMCFFFCVCVIYYHFYCFIQVSKHTYIHLSYYAVCA